MARASRRVLEEGAGKARRLYAKMRPDAAALHMTAMDDELAAALLTKLEPKVASLVMAEITPEKAAKIAAIISGAARIPPNRRPRPAPPPPLKVPANAGTAARQRLIAGQDHDERATY